LLYSFNEPTGDAQREMYLSKLNTNTGDTVALLDYPIENDARFIGFNNDTVYLSRVLSDGGYTLFSYNISSHESLELYNSSISSYLVNTTSLKEEKITFKEQMLGTSIKKMKILNTSTHDVSEIGDDSPIDWINESKILTISSDNQYHILDIVTGEYINLGEEFTTHTGITPLRVVAN